MYKSAVDLIKKEGELCYDYLFRCSKKSVETKKKILRKYLFFIYSIDNILAYKPMFPRGVMMLKFHCIYTFYRKKILILCSVLTFC